MINVMIQNSTAWRLMPHSLGNLPVSAPDCSHNTRTNARSAIPHKTDINYRSRDVRLVPIVWQKSFWGDERNFLEPLMRFARGDVRGHIYSSKINHGPS